MSILNLDDQDWRQCQVFLPFAPYTISTITSGSLGILVPFVIFLIAMFNVFHDTWMSNFHADSMPSSKGVIFIGEDPN